MFTCRGLVPLHNACSYGHFEVTEMLLKAGANVNTMDLWQFTPLHEAASKYRVEVSYCSQGTISYTGTETRQFFSHMLAMFDICLLLFLIVLNAGLNDQLQMNEAIRNDENRRQ